MNSVTLSSNQTSYWTFSGLNLNISQCDLDSVHITVQIHNHGAQVLKNVVIIHNSSFYCLELKPEIKAQISQCHFDRSTDSNSRPTLITLINSELLLQSSYFGKFVNHNDSTVLHGYNNSRVIIDNSSFISHYSFKGAVFLQNNCYLKMTNSMISQNVATSGYSTETLREEINAIFHNTNFRENVADIGGAINVKDRCLVQLTKCTFSVNEGKSIIGGGGAIYVVGQVQLVVEHCVFSKNFAVNGGVILGRTDVLLKVKHSYFTKNMAFKAGGVICFSENATLETENTTFIHNTATYGGAILSQNHTYLLNENCTFTSNKGLLEGGAIYCNIFAVIEIKTSRFEKNEAGDYGGAMSAWDNALLEIRQTSFVQNNVAYVAGGGINAHRQSHLRVVDCIFENNSAPLGGAIFGRLFAILEVNTTSFCGNKASQSGGGINVRRKSQLLATMCKFENNSAGRGGGAIIGIIYSTMRLKETVFTDHSARLGGALLVEQKSEILITSCGFHRNSNNGYQLGQGGGAIAILGKSSLVMEKTNVTDGKSGNRGGGLYISNTRAIIVNNYFLSNKAFEGGALFIVGFGIISIRGTSFVQNIALQSGGAVTVYDYVETITIDNITCIANQAKDSGCLFVESHTLILNNCVIKLNRVDTFGAGIFIRVSRMQVGDTLRISRPNAFLTNLFLYPVHKVSFSRIKLYIL